ncbi:ABC transporter permease subunit [Jiangella mangrovi]|uniref:Peptide/nickel transport system permease protein n=1 Tax=Jiangella mangrovi TaxID=1524084 RepID=A0A7W9GX39_9ACTN|nr:peptide/nickel transport system permease protein [Jiangella mangrovi]
MTANLLDTRPARNSAANGGPDANRRLSRSIARRLVIRRVAGAPLLLIGACFAVFVAVDLSPNDPARARLGIFASAEARAQFAAEHGLDDPLPLRFLRFLADLAQFDLGDSVVRSESVNQLVAMALPVTLQLLLLTSLIAVVLSFGFGVLAAWREGRATDRVISSAAAVFYATPQFWIGLLFIQLFAVSLGVLPSGGHMPIGNGFSEWLSTLIGPAVVLALPVTAALTRVVRASVADELDKDYVRTAVGAGVPMAAVLWRNVLCNAMTGPLTVLGIYVGAMMSGAILVEVVFNVPGMGHLLIAGVTQGDLGVVRGVAIVGAASFVVVNLVIDLLYLFLSPRSVEAVA